MEIKLKPWQDKFIFSKKRYPGQWSGWATGKTLDLILRAMLYSEEIPDNLGIIFRKEYTDLRDSTVKDFEKYTGLNVDSQRNAVLSNKSTIMFRHIEELHNIQNVNLGWFGIEQADELDSDKEFFLLFGRLRRDVVASDYFKSLGLPERSGFVIGNAGEHWGKRLWRDGLLEDSEFVEASTWDNADVLPQDFLDSLKVLERTKPEIYKQFVINDWNITSDQCILITKQSIDLLNSIVHTEYRKKKVLACDPSTGGDECVIYVIENTRIIEQKILHYNDTMKIVGEIILMMERHKIEDCAIDTIGIGKGIVDRLGELGKNVIAIGSAEEALEKDRFANRRAEMWWYVMEQIQNREVEPINDEELIRQLTTLRYNPPKSNGKISLELKHETKKRLGRSPDRADAFVYGLWALKEVMEEHSLNTESFRALKRKTIFSGAAAY